MSSPPFKVKALHDYSSPHDDDLTFTAGTIITVTEEEDADWYVGEYIDPSGTKLDGLFPRNFVERYEPAAPPRPTRSRPKKEAVPETSEESAAQTSSRPEPPTSVPSEEPAPAPPTVTSPASEMPPEPKPEPAKPAPTPTARAPPPVSEKPSSFKDRIAAFNKGSAPPIAPKPVGAPSGQGFIKKPFVAPPPSRNSYVPVPREQAPVHKPYRRDEDPEIAEEQARAQKDAEAAGLTGEGTAAADEGEEAPKATSLKDRIALLQKQQQEQAARRAEATTKPKRPAKSDAAEAEATAPADEDAEGHEAATRASMDGSQELPKPPVMRTKSRETHPAASIVSDGNEADQSGAGDTTEDAAGDSSTEVDEPSDKVPARPGLPVRSSTTSVKHDETSTRGQAAEPHGQADEAEGEEDEEEEEEEEMDPEVRRKMELRERMAKMSGGMGMPGMFAPPGMPTASSKKSKPVKKAVEEETAPQSPPPAPRVPMVPVPGMSQPADEAEDESLEPASRAENAEEEDSLSSGAPPVPTSQARERGAPPPVPQGRPGESEHRGLPPPPPPPRPADPVAADVEAAEAMEEGHALPTRGVPPPVPGVPPPPPARPEGPRSPPAQERRGSLTSSLPSPPAPPPKSPESRHIARVPPIPGTVPTSPPPAPSDDTRLPPPPPPPTAAPPSRRSTQHEQPEQDEESDGGSEYEGDYDTDIASGAPHKEALKSHNKTPSGDETLSEGPRSPQQRPAPPPPPHAPPAKGTKETYEMSGAIRPPPPPPRDSQVAAPDDEYDPYRYSGAPVGAIGQFKEPSVQEPSDPSLYTRPDSLASTERPPPPPPQSPPQQVHNVPPPLPPQHQELAPASESGATGASIEAPRRSMEPRSSMNSTRRSLEHGRHTAEQGVTAHDVDLGASSLWWTQPNTIPPVFASRTDILYELEENSSSKRGGRTTVSRDVYVLFPDYSQTIVSARFDTKNPTDAQLEQRHEPPPVQPSQQALEQAHGQYAGAIVAAASQLVNAAAVEGGTPQGLIRKCIASTPGSLPPIGLRSYGALVYANLGNASVTQHDEIRPGDIVSFRNARFQGKHGPMHTKYSLDINGEHVAIVSEWDGTKKKVRAWEQGRSGSAPAKDKVRVESFKFGDLRSGEVKVWRVMGRAWVGWDGDA